MSSGSAFCTYCTILLFAEITSSTLMVSQLYHIHRTKLTRALLDFLDNMMAVVLAANYSQLNVINKTINPSIRTSLSKLENTQA